VNGSEILEGAGGQRAVELAERAGRRKASAALHLGAFKLTAHERLEAAQSIAWDTVTTRIILW
jgi:hypothetical protein